MATTYHLNHFNYKQTPAAVSPDSLHSRSLRFRSDPVRSVNVEWIKLMCLKCGLLNWNTDIELKNTTRHVSAYGFSE